MFYVKEKTDEIEVKVELNGENVFCTCPDCGKEVSVDLSCVFADGLGDMYGTAVLCKDMEQNMCIDFVRDSITAANAGVLCTGL